MSRDDKKNHRRSPEEPGVGRREFMRLAGFTVGATAVLGCSRGVEHGVMPYLIRPEEVTPGRPYWYASVCGACPAGCGILAKNRDGRPIKLEGNPDHPLSAGGLCAMGQGSVLGLYDSQRLRNPLRDGQASTWSQVDQEMKDTLASLRASGGRVRFLTDSGTGPAERARIAAFLSRFPDGRHVTYDPISVSAIAEAHLGTHGTRIVPRYRFDRAEVIVGLGADFLGHWISPVEHTAGYRAGRRLEGDGESFSHHVQFESRMTLTGSNADRRIAVPAGGMAPILAHLADELAKLEGSRVPWTSLPACTVDRQVVADLARRLRSSSRGRTLVVCGENDVGAQKLANLVNHLLGNYGDGVSETTIDLDDLATQRQGSDRDLRILLHEIEAGEVDALFVRGVNPLYDLPSGKRSAEALKRVGLVVAFAERVDETARHARFVCPEPHFLESWGDSEPFANLAALRQPAIRTIGSTRPLLESLAAWSGAPATAYEILRDSWRNNVYPRRDSDSSFEEFWNRSLHDGFVQLGRHLEGDRAPRRFDLTAVRPPGEWSAPGSGEFILEVHPSLGVMDGRHAHNPWLQELADPVAKTVWDNFVALAPAVAENMGIATGDVIRLTAGDADSTAIELPALVQPGQHEQAVAVSLGYGRAGTDRFAEVGPQWWEGRGRVDP